MRAVIAAAALLTALPYRIAAQDSARVAEAQAVLAPLVESYGVSGAEGLVREVVKRFLPAWVTPATDTAGNLWVRVGQGNPVVVFTDFSRPCSRPSRRWCTPTRATLRVYSCRATRGSRAVLLPRCGSTWAPNRAPEPWPGASAPGPR